MIRYYAEAGYNLFRTLETEQELIPFVRYEFLNTQNSVERGITINDSYAKNIITTGSILKLTQGAVVKADIQFSKSATDDKFAKTLNAEIGVMF